MWELLACFHILLIFFLILCIIFFYTWPLYTIILLILYILILYVYPQPWILTDSNKHNPFLQPSCQTYMRKHFPVHIKASESSYPKQCIYVYIPHGLIVFYGQMLHGLHYLPHADNTYMLVHSLLHNCMYKLPGISSIYQHTQLDNCSKQTCRRYLRNGKSIILVPGATKDVVLSSLYQDPIPIALKHAKGYIQLAMETNVPIVPIVCPAEYNALKKWGIMPWEQWLSNRWNMMWPLLKTWIPTAHPGKPVSMYLGPCIYVQGKTMGELQDEVFTYVYESFEQEGMRCQII
jgi:Diacylglycerol acyltransferase